MNRIHVQCPHCQSRVREDRLNKHIAKVHPNPVWIAPGIDGFIGCVIAMSMLATVCGFIFSAIFVLPFWASVSIVAIAYSVAMYFLSPVLEESRVAEQKALAAEQALLREKHRRLAECNYKGPTIEEQIAAEQARHQQEFKESYVSHEDSRSVREHREWWDEFWRNEREKADREARRLERDHERWLEEQERQRDERQREEMKRRMFE